MPPRFGIVLAQRGVPGGVPGQFGDAAYKHPAGGAHPPGEREGQSGNFLRSSSRSSRSSRSLRLARRLAYQAGLTPPISPIIAQRKAQISSSSPITVNAAPPIAAGPEEVIAICTFDTATG